MTPQPAAPAHGREANAQVAAIVIRWRGGGLAERCVRSLLDGPHRRPHEIVVVDSGSGDGGADRLARSISGIRVEALADNVGFAAAANHGVSVTAAPLILLLNPDTELLGDGLGALVAGLLADPDPAGIVPLLEDADGLSQQSWQLRRLPTTYDLALGRPGRPAFAAPPTRRVAVPQPAAAAWLIRRTVWQALGGLDVLFSPAWWEDVDFCRRLDAMVGTTGFPAKNGFVVEPRARVLHHGGSSLQDLGKQAFHDVYNKNLLAYAKRHHPGSIGLIRIGLRASRLLRSIARAGRS